MPTPHSSSTALRFGAFFFAALLTGSALAQSQGPSAYDLLKPGEDDNLAWIDFAEAASKAATAKRPVMVYFYLGVKTNKNAGEMITAQTRAFPEEEVIAASAGWLCTKVDIERPQEFAKKKVSKPGDEKEGDKEGAGGLIVPVAEWPKDITILLLDYMGRPMEKLEKIPSGKKFAVLLKKFEAFNAARIIADEKAAEKAAKKKAKEEAKQKEKEEREAKKAAKEGGEDDEGKGDEDDGGEDDGGEDDGGEDDEE